MKFKYKLAVEPRMIWIYPNYFEYLITIGLYSSDFFYISSNNIKVTKYNALSDKFFIRQIWYLPKTQKTI